MRAGDIIGSKYELVSRIGQGGMGSVWRVAHRGTGREFAIKFLNAAIAASEDSRLRFVQEAKASARINHPNIIDIFDVGETDDGTLYLVMELLDGISLAEALRSEPPYSARELLLVLAEACTALIAAHAAGVIHRDLKPPNLFLHRDRGTGFVTAKILDFGVSKVIAGDDGVSTHTGSLLGSPRYMSPEQAVSAASADARSDVWSLGVVLFEALTGRFPHDGDSSSNLVVAIATRPPKPVESVAPHLPVALRMLVDDCLKPRASRIPSAENLLDRILSIVATHDLGDVPLARPTVAKGKSRARPESFVLRTSPESIPGLATSMSRRSGSSSEARSAARASGADLAFASSNALTPVALPRAEAAEPTMLDPSTDTYRRPALGSTELLPPTPTPMGPPRDWNADASALPAAARLPGGRGTVRLPEASALLAVVEAHRAAQGTAPSPPPWPDAPSSEPSSHRDPTLESISSMNVARPPQLDVARLAHEREQADVARTKTLYVMLAIVAVLAIATSSAVIVVFARSPPKAPASASRPIDSASSPSEPASTSTPDAVSSPPSSAQVLASSEPSMVGSGAPATLVTSLPAASTRSPPARATPAPPPKKTADQLKDLGSGLGR